MGFALRAGAVLLAIGGIVDPTWRIDRQGPVPVRLASLPTSDPAAAGQMARLLQQKLADVVDFDSPDEPRVVLAAGDRVGNFVLPPDGVPVAAILLNPEARPNVRVVTATAEGPLIPRRAALVRATVAGVGMSGATSVVALEHGGVELSRVEHRWTSDDEQADLHLSYFPIDSQPRLLRVTARPLGVEHTDADNDATVLGVAEDRRLRVLVYEGRPSWAVTFLRRAIEADPVFEVSSTARASTRVHVRGGSPPQSFDSQRLARFDLVVVGAPEELRAPDISAISSFARMGGAVLFMADRRPSGSWTQLVPVEGFDELLLPDPVTLDAGPANSLRGTEFAAARRPEPGGVSHVVLKQGSASHPLVLEWPSGAGRMLFSGILDAWRYRGRDDGYGRFWTVRIADAAAASPRAIELGVDPSVAVPGSGVTITATLRETEFRTDPGGVLSQVRGRVADARGGEQWIRLWPTTSPGVFQGRWRAGASGRYGLEVTSESGARAEAIFVADDRARAPAGSDGEGLALLASSTGGIAVTGADTGPLEAWLRALPRSRHHVELRPARSLPWALSFVLLLGAEWIVHRTASRRASL